MKNNSKAAAKRTQVVMSEKSKIFVSKKTVTTKAGKKITVNVYKKNKNAKPLKTILHPLPPPTDRMSGDNAMSMVNVPQPVLSAYQMERNSRRSAEREQRKVKQLVWDANKGSFKGSIRQRFTGEKRCGITIK